LYELQEKEESDEAEENIDKTDRHRDQVALTRRSLSEKIWLSASDGWNGIDRIVAGGAP